MIKERSKLNIPSGALFLIGGRESKRAQPEKKIQKDNSEPLEIIKALLEVINKPAPVIEIITTASSEPDELFEEYQRAFSYCGTVNILHMHHTQRDEVLSSEPSERISNADAIFITGGDQAKLVDVYQDTELVRLIKDRYIHDGLIVSGTSAGAMAFSSLMILQGNKEKHQIAGAIKTTKGFELLENVCIDTHFVERARFVRMAQVVAAHPQCVGIGIEEDTALVIQNGNQAKVVGSGVVIIQEPFKAIEASATSAGKSLSIRDLIVHILSKGDEYSLQP